MSHHQASPSAARRPWAQHENRGSRPRFYIRRSSSLRLPLVSLILFVAWTCLLGAAAQEIHGGDRQARQARQASAPLLVPQDDEPAWKRPALGVLVVDTSPPPALPQLMPPLHRRQEDATKTTSAPLTARSIETDPDATSTDFQIPKPFDTALSNNFTDNCAAFFKRLLTNSSVESCHPFSLMLQTSSGFFDASKSFVRITQTLEATCDVNATQCLDTMNDFARQLVDESNCRVDYDNNNPQVLQAYNGLIAYEPLYQASCLRDEDGSFCYANAVTNTSATTDSYPYYLPLGVSLPGGARPTCNSCLQDAMAIFSSFAGNSTQPVSQTYNGAAAQIQLACGPTFVNKTATPLKGAASSTTVSITPMITLFIMLFLYFFQ